MKVKPLDKILIKSYLSVLSIISIPFGFFSIFIQPENLDINLWVVILAVIFTVIYVVLLLWANLINDVDIKIKNTKVVISYGDLLNINDGIKVITFNEFFDTKVDNVIIAKKTINGQFIEKFYNNDIVELDEEIDSELINEQYEVIDRIRGKKKRYKVGTAIRLKEDYIAIAFAKFDGDNKEYLSKRDYVLFLTDLWDNIDKMHSHRNIYLPLIGSGICRIGSGLKPQDYLEQLLSSLKLSNMDLPYDCKINIVLSESLKEQINLFKIRDTYGDDFI